MPTEKELEERFITPGGYLRVPKALTQAHGSPVYYPNPVVEVKEVGDKVVLTYTFPKGELEQAGKAKQE